MEYTRVEATVKRYNETSKMKKVAKARRALFLLAADIFFVRVWLDGEELRKHWVISFFKIHARVSHYRLKLKMHFN